MCDEISHSYLVIGNRIMGWESWVRPLPHRRHNPRTTWKLRASCPETKIKNTRNTENNDTPEIKEPRRNIMTAPYNQFRITVDGLSQD